MNRESPPPAFSENVAVTLTIPPEARRALRGAGICVTNAVMIFAPYSEEDCIYQIANWSKRARRGVCKPRKAVEWMLKSERYLEVDFKIPLERYLYLRRAAEAVGVSPEEWMLAAVGYRALLEMNRAEKTRVIQGPWKR